MKLDDELCYCFHVRKRKILNYLRVHRLRHASQLSDCGGAGTGCGWCIPYLKRCFDQFQAGQATDADEISVADYAAGRAEHLAKKADQPTSSEPGRETV